MATIADGDDVAESLSRLEGAWVAAVGTVSSAELSLQGPGGAPETIAGFGPATVVSLLGPAKGPLMVVLALHEGGAVVAGRLSRAVSAGVTYTVLGPATAGAVAPAPAPAPAGGANAVKAAWASAASMGAKKSLKEEDEEADELPVQGDRIDHFVFGLCDVMVVQGERFKIREVGGGKLREIHVGPFRLSKPVVVDGKRVFKLVKRS